MNDNYVDLRSVNWEHGMLLTPEHFLRQERYVDSLLLWVLRYCTGAHGLVGAGGRAEPSERGSAKHDPAIDAHDDGGEEIKVSVTQCRGITRYGDIIDIDSSNALHASFPKQPHSGANELSIYIVCAPHDKVVEDAGDDGSNPQMKSSRRQQYLVKLDISGAEAGHSLLVARMKKSVSKPRYEMAGEFIPPCTTLVGHSGMVRAWRELREQLGNLAARYGELHKSIVEYNTIAGQRGMSTADDQETLRFVGRMVMALEDCAYEILDPQQPPPQFFQRLYRAIRSAAVYLDLSPPTKEYFRQLARAGETEFGPLLEQEYLTSLKGHQLNVEEDLAVAVERVAQDLHRLLRLVGGLEGKYLDYRVNAGLESQTFFFDRAFDPPALFQSIAKPSRPQQSFAEDMTFVLAQLKLEGQLGYRLVLIGKADATLDVGTRVVAEVRMNVGAGQRIDPLFPKEVCDVPGQRNVAIDFSVPAEVHTVSDIRVILPSTSPFKSCVLFVRRLLQPEAKLGGPPQTRLGPLEPEPAPPEPRRTGGRLSQFEQVPFDEEDEPAEPRPRWGTKLPPRRRE
jgi:hypothetical protein